MTASERLLLLSSKKQQFEKLNRSAISAMFYLFTYFFYASLMPQEGVSSFGLMALKKRFLKGVFSPCCLKLSSDFFPNVSLRELHKLNDWH